MERYVWANWWDHAEYDCDFVTCDAIQLDRTVFEVLTEICEIVPGGKPLLIRPKVWSEYQTYIFFLVLRNGGVVSGGACGHLTDTTSTLLRALGELARHASCAQKVLNENAVPTTFYEKRLAFMTTAKAGEMLVERMERRGTREMKLPEVRIDGAVSHSLQEVVAAHRCLFINQPPFIGGSLERMCL